MAAAHHIERRRRCGAAADASLEDLGAVRVMSRPLAHQLPGSLRRNARACTRITGSAGQVMRVVAAVVGATTTAASMCETCPAWRTCERWPRRRKGLSGSGTPAPPTRFMASTRPPVRSSLATSQSGTAMSRGGGRLTLHARFGYEYWPAMLVRRRRWLDRASGLRRRRPGGCDMGSLGATHLISLLHAVAINAANMWGSNNLSCQILGVDICLVR